MKKLILFWCIIATGICNIAAMKKHTCMDHTSVEHPHVGHFLYEHRKDKDQSAVFRQVKKMLEAGAKLDAPCEKKLCPAMKCHPLFIATQSSYKINENILKLLLKHHKNIKNVFLQCPGVEHMPIKKLKILLDHGANPNNGVSLFRLIKTAKFNHLALLFSHGASIKNKHYQTNESFLQAVLSYNKETFFRYGCHPTVASAYYFWVLTDLVSKGLKLTWNDIDTTTKQSDEIVSEFHRRGNLSISSLQLEPNFNPNTPCDDAGLTLLHYTILYKRYIQVEELIELGANLHKKCCYGLSPYDIYLQLKSTAQKYEVARLKETFQTPKQCKVKDENHTCIICFELITKNAAYFLCCKQKLHTVCAKSWHKTQEQNKQKKTCPHCGIEL